MLRSLLSAFRPSGMAARVRGGAAAASAAPAARSVTTGAPSLADAVSGATDFKVGRINHVAIAVPDLAASSKMYREVFGAQVSEPHPQPEHGVFTVFVDLGPGNTKVELLHPMGPNSPISKFLEKNPSGGIHHVCFEVPDINKALDQMNAKGIKVIDPKPKIGAHGKPVVFLHPKSCNSVLVELEQA